MPMDRVVDHHTNLMNDGNVSVMLILLMIAVPVLI